nr:MAG TPA_asm: hypothetical protein [Caudoviricetes sp.]
MDLPLWLSLQFWCHRPPHAAMSGVLEPRGGNEPPHVHGVVHGRRFRSSTRHMPHRCYLHVGTQLSTQRQGLCVSRLDYHTPVPQHRSDRQPVSHTDAVFSRHCHSL